MKYSRYTTLCSTLAKIALAGLTLTAASSSFAAVDKPSVIDSSKLPSKPYRDTGLVYSLSGGYYHVGSGYLVNNRVALTAAHVLFDTSSLTWRTGVNFDQAFDSNINYAAGTPTAGGLHLQSYSDALSAYMASPDYAEGMQDYTTFNSDVAVVYSVQNISDYYGAYTISRRGESSHASEQWSALLLGYPVNSTYISAANAGFMHQTGPSKWSIVDLYGNNDGTALVGTTNATLWISEAQVVAYSGNSGGPLFVFDPDEEAYMNVGEVLGGNDNEAQASTLFHIIDESTQDLLNSAITAASPESDLSPTTMTASGTKNSITLGWFDSATNETGWQIRRNNGEGWEVIATAAANSTSYVDSTAEAGVSYQYAVRAVQNLASDTNKGPWSNRSAAARTSVVPNLKLARGLGAPYLYVTTEGDAPFHVSADGTNVISGTILNRQSSSLNITVMGPGTLSCSISTSTEANYDFVTLYLDGNEVAKTSGENPFAPRSINIPTSGKHVVKVTYAKDGYTTYGNDRVVLKDVRYFCTSSTEAVQGGVTTSNGWRYSTWLGHYYDYGNRWIYSYTMGYVYMDPVTSAAWTSDPSLWAYFNQGDTGYPKIGWCWIGLKTFPTIWSVNQDWLYYYEGTNWLQKYSGDKAWIKL